MPSLQADYSCVFQDFSSAITARSEKFSPRSADDYFWVSLRQES
jgi:hypothetical protein